MKNVDAGKDYLQKQFCGKCERSLKKAWFQSSKKWWPFVVSLKHNFLLFPAKYQKESKY